MSRILTGIRSNDQLHLGNYLGAIKPMVHLQQSLKEGDKLYFFVPDLHSITTATDHSTLFKRTLETVRIYIAAGIDPNRDDTIIYRQSHIPAHSELMWILSCFTYFGEAKRMTEFKDKSRRLGDNTITVGLFNYPILMAADILLYDAEYVPLGDDQKQHMELTRTLAQRLNNKFDSIFTVPKPWDEQLKFAGRDNSLRIRSLSKPQNKMSKSINDPKGTILLTDAPEAAARKIMSAQTDTLGKINFDYNSQPGISNLLQIGALLSGVSLDNFISKWEGKTSYGELKQAVAGYVGEFLAGFQERLGQVDETQALSALEKGEVKAREQASRKLEAVQKAIGFRD